MEMGAREQNETVIRLPGVQKDVLLKLLNYEITLQWEIVVAAYLEVLETGMEKDALKNYENNLVQNEGEQFSESFSSLIFFVLSKICIICSELSISIHI